ncbi:hypothetical protein SCLARK_001348 [Spiroplasma clarkii]|nr:hypothetical protein SCLARK_001348 [Spiroplasma clarkii]
MFHRQMNLDLDSYKKACERLGRYFYIYRLITIEKGYLDRNSEFYPLATTLANIAHKDFLIILLFYLVDVYSRESWNPRELRISFSNLTSLEKCLFEVEKWIIFLVQVRGTGQSLTPLMIRLIKYLDAFSGLSNFLTELPKILQDWFSDKVSENKENENLLIGTKEALPLRVDIINSLSNDNIQDNNIAQALLSRLENHWITLNNKATNKITYTKPTLEHIMPNKLNSDWKDMLRDNKKWDQELTDKHKSYSDRIGNYLILDKPNNSELGNSKWENKKYSYSKTQSVLARIPFTVAGEDLLKLDKFDFDSIKDRSAKFAKLLVDDIYGIK